MTQPESDRAERALADYNMFDPAVLERPWEYYRKLREGAPVFRDPTTGLVLVSTYPLALQVVRNHEVFSNRFGAALAGQSSHCRTCAAPP